MQRHAVQENGEDALQALVRRLAFGSNRGIDRDSSGGLRLIRRVQLFIRNASCA